MLYSPGLERVVTDLSNTLTSAENETQAEFGNDKK